jgi:hypothetical protein
VTWGTRHGLIGGHARPGGPNEIGGRAEGVRGRRGRPRTPINPPPPSRHDRPRSQEPGDDLGTRHGLMGGTRTSRGPNGIGGRAEGVRGRRGRPRTPINPPPPTCSPRGWSRAIPRVPSSAPGAPARAPTRSAHCGPRTTSATTRPVPSGCTTRSSATSSSVTGDGTLSRRGTSRCPAPPWNRPLRTEFQRDTAEHSDGHDAGVQSASGRRSLRTRSHKGCLTTSTQRPTPVPAPRAGRGHRAGRLSRRGRT